MNISWEYLLVLVLIAVALLVAFIPDPDQLAQGTLIAFCAIAAGAARRA